MELICQFHSIPRNLDLTVLWGVLKTQHKLMCFLIISQFIRFSQVLPLKDYGLCKMLSVNISCLLGLPLNCLTRMNEIQEFLLSFVNLCKYSPHTWKHSPGICMRKAIRKVHYWLTEDHVYSETTAVCPYLSAILEEYRAQWSWVTFSNCHHGKAQMRTTSIEKFWS